LSKVITVDFDDTLAVTTTTAWGGTALMPVERIVRFIKLKIEEGFKVFIVTFRSEKDKQEVINFCKAHDLKIKHVICTAGQNKTEFVKLLKSSLHIDDHIETCTLLTMAGIEVLLVDWEQEDTNLMAQFFNKI
jgi:hypothetical protein